MRCPAAELQRSLKNVLSHFAHARPLALSIDLPPELQTPVEAALAAPVQVRVQEDESGEQFSLRIAAAGRRFRAFPAFWGVLRVAPMGADSATVTLRGTYTVPFGAVARDTDKTFLRRAAHSTLRQFLESVIQEAARSTAVRSGR